MSSVRQKLVPVAQFEDEPILKGEGAFSKTRFCTYTLHYLVIGEYIAEFFFVIDSGGLKLKFWGTGNTKIWCYFKILVVITQI